MPVHIFHLNSITLPYVSGFRVLQCDPQPEGLIIIWQPLCDKDCGLVEIISEQPCLILQSELNDFDCLYRVSSMSEEVPFICEINVDDVPDEYYYLLNNK